MSILLSVVVALIFVIGVLAGTTGMGGLLIPPLLAFAMFEDFTTAAGTSMAIYVPMAVGSGYVYLRQGHIPWATAIFLSIGAIPGAMVGAQASGYLDPSLVQLMLAVFLVVMGIRGIRSQVGGKAHTKQQISRSVLLLIGLSVGAVSAVTGVGGPVLMIPLLMALGLRAHIAVGASTACGLPLTLSASVVYAVDGEVRLIAALILGVVATVGAVTGARLAHRVNHVVLSRLVAVVLILVGLLTVGSALSMLG